MFFSADWNAAAVTAAGLIVESAQLGEVARIAGISRDRTVAAAVFALLNAEVNGQGIARGRKQIGDRASGGKRVRLGILKGVPSGKMPAACTTLTVPCVRHRYPECSPPVRSLGTRVRPRRNEWRLRSSVLAPGIREDRGYIPSDHTTATGISYGDFCLAVFSRRSLSANFAAAILYHIRGHEVREIVAVEASRSLCWLCQNPRRS